MSADRFTSYLRLVVRPMNRITLTALLLCTGCIPIRTRDSTHQLVIGIGIVSTPRQPVDEPVVIKTQYLGVLAGQEPAARFGLGYGSSISTVIPTNRNVVVEVSDGPFQPVRVETYE